MLTCCACLLSSSLAGAISADAPLFLFDAPPLSNQPREVANSILDAWRSLPSNLEPHAMFRLPFVSLQSDSEREYLETVLAALQKEDVPVFLTAGIDAGAHLYPVSTVTGLLRGYSTIKGAYVEGLAFNQYHEFANGDAMGEPPEARWLAALIEETAKVRRFAAIALDELHWPRVMSNDWCSRLYDTIKKNQSRVLPLNLQRGHHNITRISALMGLWLEGAVEDWGISISSDWYREAGFIRPGQFGHAQGDSVVMPPELYNAMLLQGSMLGATVYHLRKPEDLWFGESRGTYWEPVLRPALAALADTGLIVEQDAIREKVKVAYRLAPSRTAKAFHANLTDIDGVHDDGHMLHGAYGLERPGQVPELIPNTGRNYWIPIFSAHTNEERLGSFERVIGPGDLPTVGAWRDTLLRHYSPAEQGTAFVISAGKHTFILHTRENLFESQTFRLPEAAAPVVGFRADRGQNGVIVSWPFREGDLDFRVYRRAGGEKGFSLIAEDIETRRFLDESAPRGQTATYRVEARTNEKQPYAGTVNFGDYRAVNRTLSHHAHEVTLRRTQRSAASLPIQRKDTRPSKTEWWPNLEGLGGAQRAAAKNIADRILEWESAFAAERLNGVADLYATDYEDAQGWGFQYALRSYQWFFDRYDRLRMDRQIRRWDFSRFGNVREVRVLLYARFNGLAETDATGRFADIPAYFPRATTGETWLTFTNAEGPWRIVHTNPALPNLNDILSFSAGPGDNAGPGPDLPRR